MAEEKLFNKRETYQRLNCSLATLDRQIRLGKIIPCKLGKKVLFIEREIARFIRAGESVGRRLARERMRLIGNA